MKSKLFIWIKFFSNIDIRIEHTVIQSRKQVPIFGASNRSCFVTMLVTNVCFNFQFRKSALVFNRASLQQKTRKLPSQDRIQDD